MIRNYTAVTTLIRNRLNDSHKPMEEKIHWFHEKGVSLKIEDGDLYTLKTEKDGHKSELIEVCQRGLIYRGSKLICFMGEHTPEASIDKMEEYPLTLDENSTLYWQPLSGRNIYMFHDPKINNWSFADDKNSKTNYGKILKSLMFNIMSVDILFTYHIKVVESGPSRGNYLWTMIQTKTGKERNYNYVHDHCVRLKMQHQDIYKFEGLDKLEESDLPLIIVDASMRKVKIVNE